MSTAPGTIERPDFDVSNDVRGERNFIVTVFNNDTNTYEEVITILMLATRCSSEEAFIEAWEIDNLGQSVVHQATSEECERIAEIIRTIGIHVEVSKD